MKLSPITYNGSTITAYSPRIIGGPFENSVRIIDVDRVNDSVAYGGKSFQPTDFDLAFQLRSTSPESDAEAIGKLFHTRQGLGTLVAEDTNDAGTAAYYLECTPERFLPRKNLYAPIRMWTPDPIWKKVTPGTTTINVAGTGTTNGTIINNGNVDTYPSITITPISTGGAYTRRRHIIAYNPVAYALPHYPLDVTGGGIDTAALVSGTIIQNDGDDIRVMANGIVLERWFGGTVSTGTATKIWSVLDFDAGISATLQTALGASGDTAIIFKDTAANRKAIQKMPRRGIVLIENECIAYTSKNVTARKLTIANTGRGIKDTTAATHTAGVTVRWIQYDLLLQYGNLTAETPVQTDTYKPVFSLENSTNTNWRYDSADSVFADEAGLRAGGWKPSKPRGVYSDWYGGNQGTAGTDPVTDMGAEIVSYLSSTGIYRAETAQIWWTFSNPCGITLISSLGEKYKSGTATPWPTTRLLSSINGLTWVQEWAEATPGTAATWTAWTHSAEALPTGTRYVRFEFYGAVNAVSGAVARNEINLGAAGSMGVSFNASNVPQITLKNEALNGNVDFVLANSTTGDSLDYQFPLKENTILTIDTENRQVSYENRLLSPPELSSIRQEWLRLQPGTSVITYTDNSAGSVTVQFTYKERKNL